MKKTSVFAALIAAFTLTSCDDNPAQAAASDASAAAAAGVHWCQPWENKIEEYLASVKDEQRRKEFADIYAPLRQNMRNIQENMMKTTPEQRKQECDALISQLEKDIAEDIEDAKSE